MSLSAFLARKTTLCLGRSLQGVCLKGRNIWLMRRDGREEELPLSGIRRVIISGIANLPLPVLRKFLTAGIGVDWLDALGRPVALLRGEREYRPAFLPRQLEWGSGPEALELARRLLLAKLDNCHEVLRRRLEKPPDWSHFREGLRNASEASVMRGFEGMAAKMYFGAWETGEFAWRGRSPHPPPDPVNLLLSSGYSLLRNRLASSLAWAGLDPLEGFFHETRGRHCALASDLMEPLRAVVDTRVLTMLRRHFLKPADFKIRGDACAYAGNNAFVKVLGEWEDMFETPHKFHLDPADPGDAAERTINDLLDDMAASFRACICNEGEMMIPRLAQWSVVS